MPFGVDSSDSLLLFELNDSEHLEAVDIGEGLLEVKNHRNLYVIIPMGNHTQHDITLPQKMILGSIQLIDRIVQTDSPDGQRGRVEIRSAEVVDGRNAPPLLWHSPVYISHLEERQQEIVKQMLCEESAAFAKDSSDVGCIPNLQMPIHLMDKIPVQRTYSSIPKLLFKEVKEYIQDLLAKGWIVKSKSPYSAPIVCVRKKDGTLRLCVDYHLLNQKTVPDRHPLPRIQDLLNTLGGYSWFSILD